MLVVIASQDRQTLLIERADYAGFWQSVTGSQETGETFAQTAARELAEETGFHAADGTLVDLHYENVYCIYPRWRQRYPSGTTHNRERCFALILPAARPPTLAPREHVAWQWLPLADAASRASSWSNAAAMQSLQRRWAIVVPSSGGAR